MLVGIRSELRTKLEGITHGRQAKLIVTTTRRRGWGEHIRFEVKKVVPLVKKRELRWGQ
jgi:hypothetical protein